MNCSRDDSTRSSSPSAAAAPLASRTRKQDHKVRTRAMTPLLRELAALELLDVLRQLRVGGDERRDLLLEDRGFAAQRLEVDGQLGAGLELLEQRQRAARVRRRRDVVRQAGPEAHHLDAVALQPL